MTRARNRRRTRRMSPRPRRADIRDAGPLATIDSWEGVAMTVQLPMVSLAGGRLPAMAVGDVLALAPVVWMESYLPVGEGPDRLPDDDGDWWCGPAGTVLARGDLVWPEEAADQVYLLDVGGYRFPLNWTNTDPFRSPRIEACGGLYLDPHLDRDGLLGPSGDCCRAPLRVTAVRRYALTGNVPHDPVDLERVPDPWDVDPTVSYVADLVVPGGRA